MLNLPSASKKKGNKNMRASFQQSKSVLRKASTTYRPTFKQSTRRSWFSRLTPLSWFLMGLSGLLVVGMLSAGISRAVSAQNGSMLLSDRIGQKTAAQSAPQPVVQPVAQTTASDVTKAVTNTKPDKAVEVNKPAVTDKTSPREAAPAKQKQTSDDQAAAPVPAAVVPAAQTSAQTGAQTGASAAVPASLPVGAPATDASRAPWASTMVLAPDGSRVPPADVVHAAALSVQSWFEASRGADPKAFIKSRDTLLTTHLADTALTQQREQDKTQKTFAINREGKFSVEVKGFSEDGYTARAGVVMRGWVNDLYNLKTGKLVKKNVAQPDQLMILTIRYDLTTRQWKIISFDDIVPLNA